MDRDISPPPLKRQRVTRTPTEPERRQSGLDLRLFSYNVNGIAPFIQKPITSFFTSDKALQPRPQASLRDFLQRHDFPHILFLQEVKINPSDSASLKTVSHAINRGSTEPEANPDYVAHFCLPGDKYNATGFSRKVYGVCSIVRQDFADQYLDRMRTVDWDAEGRFSVIETKAGLDLPKLAIFNVYMVNGTDNSYKDPITGAVTGTRHTRKLAVHCLLQTEVRKLESDGYRVIIAGDINIAVANIDGYPNLRVAPHQHVLNRADFTSRFLSNAKINDMGSDESTVTLEGPNAGLDMVDTFRSLHPDRKGYSYYPRGRSFGESCDRVDMILCSRALGADCMEAGMLATAADRGTSDHVPIYATFQFSNHPNADTPEAKRKTSSQDKLLH
jgi:exonuclease III